MSIQNQTAIIMLPSTIILYYFKDSRNFQSILLCVSYRSSSSMKCETLIENDKTFVNEYLLISIINFLDQRGSITNPLTNKFTRKIHSLSMSWLCTVDILDVTNVCFTFICLLLFSFFVHFLSFMLLISFFVVQLHVLLSFGFFSRIWIVYILATQMFCFCRSQFVLDFAKSI